MNTNVAQGRCSLSSVGRVRDHQRPDCITGGGVPPSGISGVSGSGIANAGTLTLTDDTVTGNTTILNGGGVYNTGMLTVIDCSITNNSAAIGVGIFNGGTLDVERSTFSGNTAVGNNGNKGPASEFRCRQAAGRDSAAPCSNSGSGTAMLVDSTISKGNTAQEETRPGPRLEAGRTTGAAAGRAGTAPRRVQLQRRVERAYSVKRPARRLAYSLIGSYSRGRRPGGFGGGGSSGGGSPSPTSGALAEPVVSVVPVVYAGHFNLGGYRRWLGPGSGRVCSTTAARSPSPPSTIANNQSVGGSARLPGLAPARGTWSGHRRRVFSRWAGLPRSIAPSLPATPRPPKNPDVSEHVRQCGFQPDRQQHGKQWIRGAGQPERQSDAGAAGVQRWTDPDNGTARRQSGPG